jgi:nucleotide-binding universal stress UspA family protein
MKGHAMPPISHILVATDFSGRAARAVELAARLAHDHQATLHLVHVMDRLLLQMFAGTLDEHPLANEQRLLESARGRLKELAHELASQFGVPVNDEVLIGRIHAQVAEYALTHAIDLTVFGAHGENFVRDMFVGSTASKFLRKGRQPTLVARSGDKRPYHQVLVAVDLSPASRLAVEWAVRLAPHAAIHVLHVSELLFEGKMRYAGIPEDDIAMYRRIAEQEARRALEVFLGSIEGTASMTRSVLHGVPSSTIVAQVQQRQADLLVMGKRGKLEFDEFLLGSVTLRVLEEINRDLLLVAPAPS